MRITVFKQLERKRTLATMFGTAWGSRAEAIIDYSSWVLKDIKGNLISHPSSISISLSLETSLPYSHPVRGEILLVMGDHYFYFGIDLTVPLSWDKTCLIQLLLIWFWFCLWKLTGKFSPFNLIVLKMPSHHQKHNFSGLVIVGPSASPPQCENEKRVMETKMNQDLG